MPPIVVFTDGATSGNPGPGGWGAVIATGDGDVLELGGSAQDTTNNRMELTAAIEALTVLASVERPIILYSDSSYVVKGITRWLPSWRHRLRLEQRRAFELRDQRGVVKHIH